MRLSIIITTVLLAILLVVGCTDDKTCDDQTRAISKTYGDPDDAVVYDANDYARMTWTYWDRGFEYIFEWGADFDGCRVTRYDFEPPQSVPLYEGYSPDETYAPLIDRTITIYGKSARAKAEAMQSKTMTEQYFCPSMQSPTR